jgi:predicted O-methyltransferase YrrM
MSLLNRLQKTTNSALAIFNLKVESLTVERLERQRFEGLERNGHFERPILPVLPQFKNCDPSSVFRAVQSYAGELASFATATAGGERYSFDNDYFTSPDAEVLYALVRLHRPRQIIEVGSGHSTLLFREAIKKGQLSTRLTSIDPRPRRQIAAIADEVIAARVEDLHDLKRFADLRSGDVVFIDSSHEVKPGNDVLFLLLEVLPALAKGVLIHIHDIFLPYEYPKEWLIARKWMWMEQYMVQALLHDAARFDILWPGYYLQRTCSDFNRHFANWHGDAAKSLWLQIK